MSKIAVIGIAGNSVFLPVEQFHQGGETVEASSVHFEPGGKGFNQAVAAARFGAEVSFLAAIGDDHEAEIASFLERESIRAVLVRKAGCTAFAAIVTDREGSNRVTVCQGVQLTAEDVACFEPLIAEADLLLLNNEVSEQVNLRAIELAKKYGVRCVLNPAPARASHPYILEQVELFTPNEHELEGLEDRNNVIVTLGKRGCLIKETRRVIPPCSFGKTVDTTGAGDTFNGILAAMLARGHDAESAARAANAVAAISVTARYAVSSIPTKEKIQATIQHLQEE